MGLLTFQVSRAVRNASWDRLGANKLSSLVSCYKYSNISRIRAKFLSIFTKIYLPFRRVDVRQMSVGMEIVFTALRLSLLMKEEGLRGWFFATISFASKISKWFAVGCKSWSIKVKGQYRTDYRYNSSWVVTRGSNVIHFWLVTEQMTIVRWSTVAQLKISIVFDHVPSFELFLKCSFIVLK